MKFPKRKRGRPRKIRVDAFSKEEPPEKGEDETMVHACNLPKLPDVVKMNHRELMKFAFTEDGFPYRLEFLSLPEDIQDQVVDMVDSGATYEEASNWLKSKGFAMSRFSVQRYYNLLRATRNDIERGAMLHTIQARYGGMDPITTLQSAINLAHTQCLRMLATDEIPVDMIPELLNQLTKSLSILMKKRQVEAQVRKNVNRAVVLCDEEKKKTIKRLAYGIYE